MKKIMYLLLVIISICILSITSYGSINYKVNNKVYTYKGKDVTIKLNNKVINTDIPPIIHNNRTLIPIRALIEELGGDVQWNNAERKITIQLDNSTIVMNVDSNIATVNKKKVELDVPPYIAYENGNTSTGRTVVPIRFVMENCGLEVDWDEKNYNVLVTKKIKENEEKTSNNSVTNVQYNVTDDKIIVRITTENEMKYKITDMQDTYRTVIDIENSDFSYTSKNITVDTGNIEKIRTGQGEDYARVVVDLYDKENYTVSLNKSKTILTIEYDYTEQQIKNIGIDTSNSTKSLINIEGNNISRYDIRRLTGPERIQLTIYDIDVEDRNVLVNKSINNKYINKIVSNNNNGNVQIIIYLNDQYQYSFSKTSQKGVITVYNSGISNMEYSNSSKYILDLNLTKSININDIEYNHDRATNMFTLKLPLSYATLGQGGFKVGDKYIESIDITNDSKEYTIKIKGYITCDYIVNSNNKTLSIQVDKRDISRGLIIVVDPGHVGKGGVGAAYGGVIERTINTAVAKKLISMLEELDNVEVYSTMGLNYVTLYEATDFANNMGADLFISIHCNAAVSATGEPLESATGTETYYALKDGDSNYGITSQKLAQFIQTSLIKEIGSKDRGVIRRDTLAVLRTSNMPAMLTELGFMSSTEELKKLTDKSYQERYAEAIFEGIVDAIEYMKNK